MAYREFEYEKHYAAPDTSQAYAAQIQGITNLFREMRQRQDQKRKAADQFEYDLKGGSFENDTKILNQLGINVTQRAKQEVRSTGRLSMDTQQLMQQGTGWKQLSANQLERAKALRQNISDREKDPYYNSEPDIKLIQDATHGKDNDVDFRTRGERLAKAEQEVGGIDTFRFDKYRADYVKSIGTQSISKETPLKDGSSKTIFNQATFWDKETGKPGVTDQQAINFINSDSRMAQWYDAKISKELDDEIKKMKSSGDNRVDWMKGKSNAEIKNELINDPSKNLITKDDYGVRVRNKAKYDLEEADRINTKVSYTSLTGDNNGSGGRWKNQNILHEDSVIGFAQEAKSADGKMSTVTTYGPGGRFTQKNGRPITIDTVNPVRTDINKGITTRNNKGNLKLNMTGYQLMPVKKGMAPFALKSNTSDGMIEEINNMPLEYFDPAGKMALQPEMKIGINGYTVNEAGVLNDIQDQMIDLATQINEAKKNNDKEKLSALQDLEYSLTELKSTIGSGDYNPQDLITAGNKAGVRKIQQSWIIPADQSDLANIKNISGGFDLRDPAYWSPEMQAVQTAYKKRYEEAKSKGFKGEEKEQMYTIRGKDWAKSAVEKAATASGMTVDEYLREVNK